MKRTILLLLMFYRLVAIAQDSTQYQKDWNMMIGVEARTDKKCPVAYHVKFLHQPKSVSIAIDPLGIQKMSVKKNIDFNWGFALKVIPFNYEETSGKIDLVYKGGVVPGYTVGRFAYRIQGICFKPGYVFAHTLRRNSYISHTLSAVLTQSKHDAMIEYGNNLSATVKKDFSLQAEYEFLVGVRLLNHFLLSAAVQLGTKQRDKAIITDVLPWYVSYHRYTPAQGYNSKGVLYLNASFGLSYVF
jgi:hypothetical protein